MKAKIIPSLLFGTIKEYEETIKIYDELVETLHIDICDGVYVSTKTPSLEEILILARKFPSIKLNIHLMVANPVEIIQNLKHIDTKNIKVIYIHIEKIDEKNLDQLQYDFPSIEFALVIRPDALSVEIFKRRSMLLKVKSILLLSVVPGKMNGEFVPKVFKKISFINEMGFTGKFHFDGHMNENTIPMVIQYAPELINVGSSLNDSGDKVKMLNTLRNLLYEQDIAK